MKRCSTSLIIRKVQIKTTMRYYLIPVRMAIINKQEIASISKGVEERAPLFIVGGNVSWYKSGRKVMHKELPEEIWGPSSPSVPDLCKPLLTDPDALPGVD